MQPRIELRPASPTLRVCVYHYIFREICQINSRGTRTDGKLATLVQDYGFIVDEFEGAGFDKEGDPKKGS